MADGPCAHVYYGSRWKAGILFVASIGIVGLGWWLVGLETLWTEAIGWLSIATSGVFAFLWLVGIFVPNRLTIRSDGFSVKQWFLPEKQYNFEDIAALGVSRSQRIPMVVWTYNKRPESLGYVKAALGQPNDFDAYLPVGWRVSADTIAQQITLAMNAHLSRTSNQKRLKVRYSA